MNNDTGKLIGRERIEYLDIAKGIGILCIIAGHMGVAAINRVVFTFHVPLFFLISGYFLSEKNSTREFFKKRSKSLLVPYILTSICLILMKIPVDIVRGIAGEIPRDLVRTFIEALYASGTNYNKCLWGITQIGAIWFLFALLWAMLFVKLAIKSKYSAVIIMMIALISYFSSQYIWLPWSVQAGGTGCVFIYIGWKAKDNAFLSRIHWWLFWIGIIALLAEVYCEISLSIASNYFKGGLISVAGAVLISYVVIVLSGYVTKVEMLRKILLFYGQNSLMILCFHLIELNNAPWARVYSIMDGQGVASIIQILLVFCYKLIFVAICTYFALRVKKLNNKLVI